MTGITIYESAAPLVDELEDDGSGDRSWWWTDHDLAGDGLEVPIEKSAEAIAAEADRLRRGAILPWGRVRANRARPWAQFVAVDPPGYVAVELSAVRDDGQTWALQVRRAAAADGAVERITLPAGARRTYAHPATAGIVPVAGSARLTVAEAAAVAAAHLLGEPLAAAWRAVEIPWRVR